MPKPSQASPPSPARPLVRRDPPRSEDDLRAIKRALIHAPLGPTAAQALASAAIELEERLSRQRWRRVCGPDAAPRELELDAAPGGRQAEAAPPTSRENVGPAGRA